MAENRKPKNDRNRVAALAGVSTATVSRVFNNPESVSEAKRASVLAIARKLDYVPNKIAAALASSRGAEILFVDMGRLGTDTGEQALHYSSLYASALKSVSALAREEGYYIGIADEVSVTAILENSRSIAGLILFDAKDGASVSKFKKWKIPCVAGHHLPIGKNPAFFPLDNRAGGQVQLQMCFDAGYRKPLFLVSGLDTNSAHRERYEGWCRLMGEDKPTVVGSRDLSDRKISSMISEGKADCLVASNDLLAIEAYHALAAHGLSAPRDYGLAGYDNLPAGELLPVKLSTVDISLSTLYRRAAAALFTRLRGRETGMPEATIPGPVFGRTLKKPAH